MPKLILFALAALLVWIAWRAIRRELGRVASKLRDDETKAPKNDSIQPLKKDSDGVYRVSDD